jgi:nucleotide-binding universal stress UspA family protein
MTYRHVLVAVNGAPPSEVALRRAIGIARTAGARLTVMGVKETAPIFMESVRWQEDGIDDAVEAATAVAQRMGVEAEGQVLTGYPAEAIVRWCEDHGCDLVVIGTSDAEMGSVGRTADKVVDLAPCAVLVAR